MASEEKLLCLALLQLKELGQQDKQNFANCFEGLTHQLHAQMQVFEIAAQQQTSTGTTAQVRVHCTDLGGGGELVLSQKWLDVVLPWALWEGKGERG